jgi:hypothetical protein
MEGLRYLTTAMTRAGPEPDSRPARFPQRPARPSVAAMTYDIDIAALIEEIRRYLAAVDAFRAAGCEPTWQGSD